MSKLNISIDNVLITDCLKLVLFKLLLIVFIFNATNVYALGQATVKGMVKTSDGLAVEQVNIGLQGTSFGTFTNEKGEYVINNVPRGKYILVASYIGKSTKTVSIEVSASATVNVPDIILDETATNLGEITVSARAGTYKSDNPSQTLRVTTPLIELPQNVQVVTEQMLKDQQIISMSDGLVRSVSGTVRVDHWGDLYTNITSRGSQVQAFRNGFNVVSSYWGPLTEDMSLVDHIEFVKGPAGFMLAHGDPSGLYNVVTKKPTGQKKGEASLIMGSYDLYRAMLDLDGLLSRDGKLLYRLNVSGQQKGSHRPYEYNNRYAIAPVITYKPDEQTSLTFEYNFQNAKMSDLGSYYVFSTEGFAKLPVDFTLLSPGLPPTIINDHNLYLNFQHQLSPQWKVSAQLAYFNYTQEASTIWPNVVNPDGTMIRNIGNWDAESEMKMGQAFVNGDFTTGSIHHRILAGIDIANKEYYADWGQAHELDTVNGGEFDVHNPNYGVPANGYPNFDHSTPIEQRAEAVGGYIAQTYSSVYVQDELVFLDNKLRLTLAGRYSRVKQSSMGSVIPETKHFSPRAGISYSFDKNTSIYALYDQAFTPQTGALSNGKSVQPITGNNIEAGLKRDWANGQWNTTLAVYRILKNHELLTDPNSPPTSGLSIEMGQKRSQGIEFDLRGRIANGFNLIANYAFTDSRVSKVADGVTDYKVGDHVPSYVRHTANFWLNYRIQSGLLQGFGFMAGCSYLSGRYTWWDASPDPLQTLPDYFKVDAGLYWEKDRFSITANVFNVLNEYLYNGSYYLWNAAYYWQSDPPRNGRISLSYKF
ncbi:MAG: TonB-dependent receptor [Tannerella sp.]|jgi:iron complex outermembrane receptor protein|nr:TonB-dependent receptor [Tannerella sp.]